MREWLKRNPEKAAANRQRQYDRKRNPETWAADRLSNIKCRCKRNGLDFDLDEDDLLLPGVCPVLGIPLALGLPATHPNSVHVDRLDPNQGYVKGNVQIISGRANYLKKDATLEEMRAVLEYMEKANAELSGEKPRLSRDHH